MANTTPSHHLFNWHDFFRHNGTEPAERHWGWLVALGIVFVILGTIGLGMVVLMTLASILAIGILAMVGGAIQVVQAFSFSGWKGKAAHLLIGLLYLFAGWVIISDPLVASAFFTMLLAWTFIFIGILRITLSIQNRLRHRWVWPLIGGILSVILGLMILLQWPVTGLWVIGLIVSVEMIFHGWGYIALALVEKGV